MKKLLALIGVGLFFASLNANAQLTVSTNVTGAQTFVLLADRASVYSVELTSPYAALVKFYDNNSIAVPWYGTNYTNASYVGRSTVATNYVTSYVGYNGFTNWYTNAGIWTYSVTNAAATNALSPAASFVVGAGTYAVYNTDAIFNRGICVTVNTNVSIVVNYRTGQ